MPHNNHYGADKYNELIQEGHGDEEARAIVLLTYPHLTREYLARVLAHAASKPEVPPKPARVWPPTQWGEWNFQPKEAASLDDDDDEPDMAELVQRGGQKIG
jgi:hypothetical protein